MAESVRIEHDVEVPMRDGTVLRADVYRPAADGPFPVLLHRTPYGKREPMTIGLILNTFAAVERGYIVVHQDTRGRFASDGEWLPWEHERNDGYDTVQWAAGLQGSSGKVGTFGGSYTGSTQWSAAIAGAPALHAMVPQVTWSDPMDGLYQRGGALELGLSVPWTLLTGAGHLPKCTNADELLPALMSLVADYDDLATRTYWELPSGRMPANARYGGPDLGTERTLLEPDAAALNRVVGHHRSISVPSLNIAGWYDIFLQGSLDNFMASAAAGTPTKLVVGPWTHQSIAGLDQGRVGDVNFGLVSSVGMIKGQPSTELQLRWYDHWLKGRDTGLMEEAPVAIFVMGTNVWRDEQEWPPARAVETAWYLGSAGTLRPVPATEDVAPDEYDYDPADPVITRGGPLVMSPDFPSGVFDQSAAESRDDVLLYTSEVLEQDLEVTGRVRVRLWAATDCPSTDWVVRLCDVDAHGVSRNVTDGILRVSAEPGVPAEYEIDLWSTSMVFLAGHRLRVHVTSSNFPRWDRNTNTGGNNAENTDFRIAHQTIFLDANRPSRILLPVIPSA